MPHAGTPNGDVAETPALQFFGRLASVQLVAGVAEQVSHRYCRIKARSALLSAALAKVENAAVAVLRRCEPAARTMLGRRQLEYVDSLACRSLEKLERRYPAALRKPQLIVTDVTAFGRRKAEQAKKFAREKVDSVLTVLPAAACMAAHPAELLAAALRQVVRFRNRVLHLVDDYLDDFISAYDPMHVPLHNDVAAHPTMARTAPLRKVVTAVNVRLAYEAQRLQGKVLHKCGGLLNSWQNVLLRSQPSKFDHTPMDHALAAVQHVYLMSALLAGRPGRFYRGFYLHVAHFYPLRITLPEPLSRPCPALMTDSSSESTSSGSRQSAAFSDDSFHSQESE